MEIHTSSLSPPIVPATAPATDAMLVTRVRKGDIDAFERIMRRHNQRLFRIARSILRDDQEAMDVVQETWIKTWFQLHQFKGPDGFASWLSRIAANEAMTRMRKSKLLDYSLDDPEKQQLDMEAPDPRLVDALANLQLRQFLEEAIDTLPLSQRSVYVMRAVQQLSVHETASCLDLSEAVVKTRFLRARRALQKVLREQLDKTGLEVFEFAGKRCNSIVKNVLQRVKAG